MSDREVAYVVRDDAGEVVEIVLVDGTSILLAGWDEADPRQRFVAQPGSLQQGPAPLKER